MGLVTPDGTGSPAEAAPAPAKTVPVPSYVFVHDPSMTKEGNTWYLFSTGDPQGVVDGGNIQIRESTNLDELAADRLSVPGNPVVDRAEAGRGGPEPVVA